MYRIVHFKRKPQQETVSSKTAKLIHDVRSVIGYTKVHLATFQNGTVGPASSTGLFFSQKKAKLSILFPKMYENKHWEKFQRGDQRCLSQRGSHCNIQLSINGKERTSSLFHLSQYITLSYRSIWKKAFYKQWCLTICTTLVKLSLKTKKGYKQGFVFNYVRRGVRKGLSTSDSVWKIYTEKKTGF